VPCLGGLRAVVTNSSQSDDMRPKGPSISFFFYSPGLVTVVFLLGLVGVVDGLDVVLGLGVGGESDGAASDAGAGVSGGLAASVTAAAEVVDLSMDDEGATNDALATIQVYQHVFLLDAGVAVVISPCHSEVTNVLVVSVVGVGTVRVGIERVEMAC